MKRWRTCLAFSISMLMLLIAGCEDSAPPVAPPGPPVVSAPAPLAPVPPVPVNTTPATPAAPIPVPPLPPPLPGQNAGANTPASPPSPGNLTPAEAGVGKRGQGLEGGGIYTEPVRVLFRVEQRLVFEIQIPQAMNLYKAEHDRLPKSHEEFMSKIIEANLIKLPELPEGDKYVYVPEQGQLMVQQKSP